MKRLIIFEGISGSGKTTLFHPVHKLSDYADLQVHRLTPTHWVMDRLYDRRKSDFAREERALQEAFDVVVIWTDCSPETAAERQKEKGDPMVEDLARAKDLFLEYFTTRTRFRNVIRVNTDRLSVEESVEYIASRMETFRNSSDSAN